ncbi:MAG: Lactoylglutathione lyase [Piccolia ochrophora]|nr:MAG: Lactoylglutathione lyase [Piccolia ochrophora]
MATDTSIYKFNHSMIRVKDPQRSIKYYEFLGMKLIDKLENPDAKFDLYFLAFDSPKATSHGNKRSDREGILELTHNYGTESDPNYKVANGNAEPGKGFGHTCVSVDNIQAACQRIEDAGYKFQKRLMDGRMRNIAFALDPDSYWVEIIGQKPVEETETVKETDVGTYRFNHTMIRVKDIDKTLDFYKNVMGMTLMRTVENKDSGFNLYFLAYPHGQSVPQSSKSGVNPLSSCEGLLELTWNYGTEKDPNFKYHNGNEEPQGFGHICKHYPYITGGTITDSIRSQGVSVDNLDAACSRFEEKKVSWKKRLTDGRMKNIAFVLDPDGYWIEVIQNDSLNKGSNM